MLWDQETYIKAWNFASMAHNGQCLLGSSIAYINHIGLVAMEAMASIMADPSIKEVDLFLQCALLHDVLEDTLIAYDELDYEFGAAVAQGVQALSKNPKLSSKREQILDSLARIQQQPVEIAMVKLCDRITNLQPPPQYWSVDKINAYREEAKLILSSLGSANAFLAHRLQKKIISYG